MLQSASTIAAGRFDAPLFGVRRGRDFSQGSTEIPREGVIPERYWFRKPVVIDGAGQSHTIVENPLFLQVAETNKRHVFSHRTLNHAARKPWLAGTVLRNWRECRIFPLAVAKCRMNCLWGKRGFFASQLTGLFF